MVEMKSKIEFYEKSLERVNYWLQFAEAKNAAAIAFTVAILAVVYSSKITECGLLLVVVSTVYVISMIAALLSMKPQYEKDVTTAVDRCEQTDNLLFWKDVAKYSQKEYIEKINGTLFKESELQVTEQERMYANEIITNARIAQYKYKQFEISLKFSILGTIMMLVSFVIIA